MSVDVNPCQHLMPRFLCWVCSAEFFPAQYVWVPRRDPTPRPSHYVAPTPSVAVSASLPDIPRTIERYRPPVQRYRPKDDQE